MVNFYLLFKVLCLLKGESTMFLKQSSEEGKGQRHELSISSFLYRQSGDLVSSEMSSSMNEAQLTVSGSAQVAVYRELGEGEEEPPASPVGCTLNTCLWMRATTH